MIIYFYSIIGKAIGNKDTGNNGDVEKDPFGHRDRVFQQTTEKIENAYSVNIPYEFLGTGFKKQSGWLNIINPFRAVGVLGTPGSGKSLSFFLPAIHQFIAKGFTMLLYDFKFDDLTKYGYNCLLYSSKDIQERYGYVPEFTVISLENPLYSERCNVLQPHLFKDFVVDAYGLAKALMVAINPSWKGKDGEFFSDSATNLVAAAMWSLKIYKDGKYCSLPHLIELLSQDTDSLIEMLLAMKDGSLRNVMKPFEEANATKDAAPQIQGQMGTVRIALGRMTSPKLYFMLTEDPYSNNRFDLQINSKSSPKILCLANSGQNQGINNIVLSMFITQIFRFINKKDQHPCAVMLDEAVTLSFPKGTLDTIIATGRSNLVTVWLGFQDFAQATRDFGKESADAVINMIGNLFTGSVKRETADIFEKLIGRMKIIKRSTSINPEGGDSQTVNVEKDYAVPADHIAKLSQGDFVGILSDNFDQKLEMKAFHGSVYYNPPFKKEEMVNIPYSKYWSGMLQRECEGFNEDQINSFVQEMMDINFNRVIREVEEMKEDLLGSRSMPKKKI